MSSPVVETFTPREAPDSPISPREERLGPMTLLSRKSKGASSADSSGDSRDNASDFHSAGEEGFHSAGEAEGITSQTAPAPEAAPRVPLAEMAAALQATTTSPKQDRFLFGDARDRAQVYYVSASDGAMHFVQIAKDSAESLFYSLKTKAEVFEPYYMKVHDGVASIYARIGDKVVVVRVKVTDFYGRVQTGTMNRMSAARAVIEPYTSPVIHRAISVRDGTNARIEHFTVSVKAGVVSIRGAVGEKFFKMQAQVSDVVGNIRVKTSDTLARPRQVFSDLAAQIATIVAQAYGQVCERVQLLTTKTKDGMVYISCRVNDRLVVLKIKISEVVELVQTQSRSLYNTSRTAIADAYSGACVRVVNAATLAKTKSLEAGSNARSLAGNRSAQVTAASAAGGAVAGGASGGAAGLVAGGGVGAGCGLVFAPFTLGLSIPICAVVGASAGLAIGASTGASAGLVSGGAAGYNVHKHKDEIGAGMNGAMSKVKEYKDHAAASTTNGVNGALSKVQEYKDIATVSTSRVRARFTGGTGETIPDASSD